MVRQAYLCSNASCGREYTALEAQRLIVPGQYEFHCGHCGEPLLECNNNEALHAIQLLQKKVRQLNVCWRIRKGFNNQRCFLLV